MTQGVRRAAEDRLTVHEHLMERATAAQDAVFGDASVDRAQMVVSLRALAVRLIRQLDAAEKAM